MKKILLGLAVLSTAALGNQTNVYMRAGIDMGAKYDEFRIFGESLNQEKTKGTGFEIAVEATKEIAPNFELGLGLAYQSHAKPKSLTWSEGNESEEYQMPKFDSIPLYMTAKYSFETNSAWKPYIKADLGYSFNVSKGDFEGKYYLDGALEEEFSVSTKAKNGMYFGFGAGVEYENFFADLMYKINTGKMEASEFGETISSDFDYSRVTLGFGYKFTY